MVAGAYFCPLRMSMSQDLKKLKYKGFLPSSWQYSSVQIATKLQVEVLMLQCVYMYLRSLARMHSKSSKCCCLDWMIIPQLIMKNMNIQLPLRLLTPAFSQVFSHNTACSWPTFFYCVIESDEVSLHYTGRIFELHYGSVL